MADGRLFTDYRPRCDLNYVVEGLTADKPMTSYAYRQYLIKNAGGIMNDQRSSAYSLAQCGPCMTPYDQGTMAPEKYIVKCDGQSCAVRLNDARGIGVGREYGTTPDVLKAREQFLARKEKEQAQLSQGGCCSAAAVGYA